VQDGDVRDEGVLRTTVRVQSEASSRIDRIVYFSIVGDAVVARMTHEQIRPAVISWVKSPEATPIDAPDWVVDVDDGELDRFTKLGWRFVSIVNARKAVVRWERKSDPVNPITPDSILDEDAKLGLSERQVCGLRLFRAGYANYFFRSSGFEPVIMLSGLISSARPGRG
jgi:hypothetical protein